MKKLLHRTALLVAIVLTTGCAFSPPTPDNIGEAFVLERDLIGRTVATGSFSAIDGTHREFIAYINGTWDGKAVTLIEDFEFADGEKERKTWVLTKLENGDWSGTREDVIGTARGYQDGKAFRLEYDMALPDDEGNPGRKLRFKDVIVNSTNGVIINNATVGLWGFRVATVKLLIRSSAERTDEKETLLLVNL